MANEYNFKPITEAEYLEEVPEGATVLVESGGEIKRVPGDGLGGSGGVKTAIIKMAMYDNALSEGYYMDGVPEEYDNSEMQCVNMTFDEAWDVLINGGSLSIDFLSYMEVSDSNGDYFHYFVERCLSVEFYKKGDDPAVNVIQFTFPESTMPCCWTAYGFQYGSPILRDPSSGPV